MLEKILDNYYTKKLLNEIKWCLIVRKLDYKFVFSREEVEIKVKSKQYDRKFYKAIAHIEKDEALKYLCNIDIFINQFTKILNNYMANN